MAEPTHLSVEVLHRLMRLFMEHKTDVLPVVERGRIVGQVDRAVLMEALSEIRPEGYLLSMKEPDSTDELLRRLDSNEVAGLATINRNFDFNAVWGRAEILQAQGKIPQVKIWQPPAKAMVETSLPDRPTSVASNIQPQGQQTAKAEFPSQTATSFTPVVPLASSEAPPRGEAAPTISIVREMPTPPPPSAPPPLAGEPSGLPEAGGRGIRPIAENLHREIERGRLAVNTLAALDMPLLACDGIGTEIFHNRAFAEVRLRDAINLKSEDLVHRAKDAIADSALKGDLDIDKAVKLRQGPRGYECFCKAIRDYENPTSRAVGYIFWLKAITPLNTALYSAEPGTTEFAGKALPEILAAEESRAMAWAMAESNGNQSEAAWLLQIPRQTFNYRYRKLTRPRPERRGHRKTAEKTEQNTTPNSEQPAPQKKTPVITVKNQAGET